MPKSIAQDEIADDKITKSDDYAEEQFFNSDSYDSFIRKNDISVLDDKSYINNNLHKVNIIVPNNDRITSEIMTKAEHTRIISERAEQIKNGANPFIDIGGETNPIKMAEMEIIQKKSPMKIHRFLTKNIVEIWKVSEMVIPFK
jgi:DNA-directed RNA polymerases I, II, and III subunit RPABC2